MKNKLGIKFIMFWASQTVSQLGSSMTSFALIIWAYKQTQSAMTVSLLTFFSYLPYILVSLFVGSFVDRHKKKSIMLCSDSVAAICTVVIAVLTISGQLKIWHIYSLNAVIGIMDAFQSPASSISIGLMVPKERLSNASGMNSFSSSLLSALAPMLATFLISFWGLVGVLIIDLATFAFAFLVLQVFIKIPESLKTDAPIHTSTFSGCKEGFSFFHNQKGLLYLVLSMAVMNFFSRLTYENILSPMILARSGNNDHILGIVSGILGVGGIIGGLLVSFFKLPGNTVKVIYLSAAISFVAGDLLMGLGQSPLIWCIAGFAASIPIPFVSAGQNVIVYQRVPNKMQGRVFAVRNAIQYCTTPCGILLGGFLADYVFEPFMLSTSPLALSLQRLVGKGAGSGMAVMFLCTAVLGSVSSLLWYKNKHIKKLMV